MPVLGQPLSACRGCPLCMAEWSAHRLCKAAVALCSSFTVLPRWAMLAALGVIVAEASTGVSW